MSERQRPRAIAETAATARVGRAAALMAARGPEFARTARRFSRSAEDAEDALGRAVEILLRKGPDREPEALAAWMHVVTRREAIAVRRLAARNPAAPEGSHGIALQPEALPTPGPGPAQAFERRERVAFAAALLAGLKPQERRALVLQAAGCSYAEIEAITGWTRTKVNRCLAEGRAALRARQPLPELA